MCHRANVISQTCTWTEKKMLWTWIYANLHTPALTLSENIRIQKAKKTRTNGHSHSFTHPSISYMSENEIRQAMHIHNTLNRTKNKVHSAHHCAILAPVKHMVYKPPHATWRKKMTRNERTAKKIRSSQSIYDLMAEQWPVAIHFFGAYFDNSLWKPETFCFHLFGLVCVISIKKCLSCLLVVVVVVAVAVVVVVSFVSFSIQFVQQNSANRQNHAYDASYTGNVDVVDFWLCKITKHSIIALFRVFIFFFCLHRNAFVSYFELAHSPIQEE